MFPVSASGRSTRSRRRRADVLTPIWTVKPETARRLKQRMKVVFDWAKASGFCRGDNPTDGLTKVLPKHKGDKQHHAALPYQACPGVPRDAPPLPDMRTPSASA